MKLLRLHILHSHSWLEFPWSMNSVGLTAVAFVCLTCFAITNGLDCEICFRLGQLGSANCDKMVECNNAGDIYNSSQMMDELVLNVFKTVPPSFAGVNNTEDDIKPACVKMMGIWSETSDKGMNHTHSVSHFIQAGCMNAAKGTFQVMGQSSGCQIKSLSDERVPSPVQVCVCNQEATQHYCDVSLRDLSGKTMDAITSAGKNSARSVHEALGYASNLVIKALGLILILNLFDILRTNYYMMARWS